MALIVVGVNHRGAPLDVRERLAYRTAEIARRARRAARGHRRARSRAAVDVQSHRDLSRRGRRGRRRRPYGPRSPTDSARDASTHGYVRRDRDAVTHLFRVASGLDSMVLGEAQIHGQVRDAWESCRAHSGPVLNRLFQTSLSRRRTRAQRNVGRARRGVRELGGRATGEADLRIAGRQARDGPRRRRDGRAGARVSGRSGRARRRSSRTERSSARRSSPSGMARSRCTTTSVGPLLADVDVLVCSTAAPRAVVFVGARSARARRARRPPALHPRHRAAARRRSGGRRARQRLPLQPRRSAGGGLGEPRAPARRAADGRAVDRRRGRSATGTGWPAWRRFRCSRRCALAWKRCATQELADALRRLRAPAAGRTSRRRRTFEEHS